MKTKLPNAINSIDDAKEYLTDLYNNGEAYDVHTNAHNLDWEEEAPPIEVLSKMNRLMDQILKLRGFDCVEFLTELANDI